MVNGFSLFAKTWGRLMGVFGAMILLVTTAIGFNSHYAKSEDLINLERDLKTDILENANDMTAHFQKTISLSAIQNRIYVVQSYLDQNQFNSQQLFVQIEHHKEIGGSYVSVMHSQIKQLDEERMFLQTQLENLRMSELKANAP